MLKLKNIFLYKPTKKEIELSIYVSQQEDGYPKTMEWPSGCDEEWNKDHKDWVIYYYLPQIKPPMRIWKLCVEAYLAGMELQSDGSSFVPDLMMDLKNVNIKDPWGVAHDYIFWLNRHKLADAYGHTWHLLEADKLYHDFIDAAHAKKYIADYRLVGLYLFSWIPWYLTK